MGHVGDTDEKADLDITLLGGFGEVGRANQGGVTVDDRWRR
jgi:hypothetical protein